MVSSLMNRLPLCIVVGGFRDASGILLRVRPAGEGSAGCVTVRSGRFPTNKKACSMTRTFDIPGLYNTVSSLRLVLGAKGDFLFWGIVEQR